MRILLAAGLVTVSMAAATSAYAVPEIGLTILVDGSLLTSTPLTPGGSVGIFGASDPGLFNSITITSTGVPATTDPNFGTVTITASSSFLTGTHTLTLLATQIGLAGSGLGTLASTFTYNALIGPSNVLHSVGVNYIDAGDTPYLQTTKIATTPDEGLSTVTYSSGVFNFAPTPPPLFSETEEYDLTFTGQALVETSSQITGVPEPVSLALLGSGLIGLGAIRRSRRR